MGFIPRVCRRRRTRFRLAAAGLAAIALAAAAFGATAQTAAAAARPRASSCSTTDAALNRPATASSLENSSFPASAAVDGNTSTRWSSSFSDPQWLQVDLGSSQTVCEVTLDWETAYATEFQIQVSADGTSRDKRPMRIGKPEKRSVNVL